MLPGQFNKLYDEAEIMLVELKKYLLCHQGSCQLQGSCNESRHVFYLC